MSVIQKVSEMIETLLQSSKYDLYDVEQNSGVLKVTLNAEDGITIDELAEINRKISFELDERDLIQSKYTLEVSSPGLERKLRRREHYLGATSERVSIKLGPHVDGERRFEGTLTNVEADNLTLELDPNNQIDFKLKDITSAKTVYKWEKNPKPGTKTTHSGIS